jgi:hypothetical protein
MTTTAASRSGPFSRRPFTIEEDAKLVDLVELLDSSRGWDAISARMPGRSPRQCRERWVGYLSPAIRVEPWTEAEDELLLSEISKFGHRWTTIAEHFNGRSGNDVKNRWYSHLKDITAPGPDGNYHICRDGDGNVLGQKKKRHRKLVSAYKVAADRAGQSPALKPEKVFFLPIEPMAFGFLSSIYLPPLLPRPGRDERS